MAKALRSVFGKGKRRLHRSSSVPIVRASSSFATEPSPAMEFQFFDARVEDSYPPGFDGRDKASLAEIREDPCAFEERVEVAARKCVVLLFGRNAEGESVCLRVDEVTPRLYFRAEHDERDNAALKKELRDQTLSPFSKGRLELRYRDFCHNYGFERDESSPTGRTVHRYIEASFSSISDFNQARRRHATQATLLRDVASKRKEAAQAEEDLLRTRKEATMAAGEQKEILRARVRAAENKQKHLSASADDLQDQADRAGRGQVPIAHEYFVEPLSRFLQEEGLSPGQWYVVSTEAFTGVAEARVSICDRELVSTGRRPLLVPSDRTGVADHVVCYYDIETLSLDPSEGGVIQASLVFEFAPGGGVEKHVVLVGDADREAGGMLEGVVVHSCPDEERLLTTFARVVREKDPDFMVAYNGVNFDNLFLERRAFPGLSSVQKRKEREEVRGRNGFAYLSRLAFRPCCLVERQLSSSGMGENLVHYFDMPGRANLDWFIKLKQDLTSEPSYKLDHFARTICGDHKESMDYREIPVLHHGSDADRARLASYCVHDSYLLLLLNRARTMVLEVVQFASVFGIPCEWVYFRGQQVRFVAQLLRKAREEEGVPMLLNVPSGGFRGADEAGRFEGATVVEPVRGFYKAPVVVCDWASLYPSIMRGYNLCHSTWVHPDRAEEERGREGVVACDLGGGKESLFVSASTAKGVLPRILEGLGIERAAAKAEAKRYASLANDPSSSEGERARMRTMVGVFDGKQKAVKVAMNSVYGACGAGATGKYPNLDISATVTAYGRRAMVVKREIIPRRFPGAKIVYGDTDSVMLTFSDVPDLASAAVRGEEVGAFVTDHFASVLGLPQMVLEFEKVFLPYLLEDKKRYAGKKYEPDGKGGLVDKGVDNKGLETERRDTLPFVKEIMDDVLKDLMDRMDEVAAMRSYRKHIDALVADEVPFEMYIMKKNLTSKVESKVDTIVQAKVNADRQRRAAGSEAKAGEQVEYVIVNGPRGAKTTSLAQDPVHAREQGMRPNRLWYFEHAIEKPLAKVFLPFSRSVQFEETNRRYREALDAERLGVDKSGMLRVVSARGKDVARPDEGGKKDPFATYLSRPPPRAKPQKRKRAAAA